MLKMWSMATPQALCWSSPAGSPLILSAELQTKITQGWDKWPQLTSSLWPGRSVKVWKPQRMKAPPLHQYSLWSTFLCHRTPSKVGSNHDLQSQMRCSFPKHCLTSESYTTLKIIGTPVGKKTKWNNWTTTNVLTCVTTAASSGD